MIEDLINQIQDKNIPVSVLLIKAKILTTKLNDTEFLKWLDLEINGYNKNKPYPQKYREVKGKIKALNPYNGWCPVLISNKKTEEHISSIRIRYSIPELENLLINSSKDNYMIDFSDEIAAQILGSENFKTKVTLFISSEPLIGIINSVRHLILDWVLGLDSNQEIKNKVSNEIFKIDNNIKKTSITLIEQREDDYYITKHGEDFKYKGKILKISKETYVYKVFKALYDIIPEGGYISYEDLGKEITSRGIKNSINKIRMNKFIQTNLTDNNNGLMQIAELRGTQDNGKCIVSVRQGKGIDFNNQK